MVTLTRVGRGLIHKVNSTLWEDIKLKDVAELTMHASSHLYGELLLPLCYYLADEVYVKWLECC